MRPRAKIPKPFARQSIDLGGEKRDWKDVEANELRVGDTVPGVGLLQIVENKDFLWVYIEGPETSRMLNYTESVFAFVPVRKTDGA